ncbi:MAG: DUF805 domain-containing protein [Pseudolabrys sp.]
MNFFQLMFGEWLELLFGFRGRINRTKYWLTFLIYFVALFALYILFGLFFSFPTDPVGIISDLRHPLHPYRHFECRPRHQAPARPQQERLVAVGVLSAAGRDRQYRHVHRGAVGISFSEPCAVDLGAG